MHALSVRQVVVYGIGFLVALAIMIWVIMVVQEGSGAGLAENVGKGPAPEHPPRNQPDQPHVKPPDGPGQAQVPVVKIVPPQEIERKARARAKLLDAKNLGREAGEKLDTLEKHVVVWETRTKSLLIDETGRKLADSPTAIDQADALLGKTRSNKLAVASLRNRLQALLDPVESALRVDDGTYSPTPELLGEIAAIERTAVDGNRQYELDHAVLQTLLADHVSRKPAGLTLGEAIAKQRSTVASKEADDLAKAKAKAREAAAEKIRQAEAEATLKIAEAEAYAAKLLGEERAKRLKEQADLAKKNLEQIIAAEARKANAERLKKLAEDPAIQAKYKALLTPGKFQFNTPQGGLPRYSARPEPASLAELSANKWMANAENFARAMSAKPHIDYEWINDRPVPPFPKSTADWTSMDHMLEEFRLLAPIWVE